MNDEPRFEQRLAAMIAAYAERAPTDVDAALMARLAATEATARGSRLTGWARSSRPPSLVLLGAALLIAIVTATLVASGALVRHAPDDLLTRRGFVEPFTGLPPIGASPSSPEPGQLVVSLFGRVHALGLDFYRMWLYDDGRLIWKRNLDNRTNLRAFGSVDPTTALIEQRLTPEGVELLRSVALAARLQDLGPAEGHAATAHSLPGVIWGGMRVQTRDGLREVTWSDGSLPGLLADPARWLPTTVWEDGRLGGYVPSRYAVCLEHSPGNEADRIDRRQILDLLPERIGDLIRARATPVVGAEVGDDRCLYVVATEDARVIAAALAEAGPLGRGELRYMLPRELLPSGDAWLELLPILPNGEAVCNCG